MHLPERQTESEEPPRVKKFTPDGKEMPMDKNEHEAALRAFQKHLAWREEDRRRRTMFGSYSGVPTYVQGDLRLIGIGDSVYYASKDVPTIAFFARFAMSLLGDNWKSGRLVNDPESTHPIAVWSLLSEEHFRNGKPDPDGFVRLMPNGATVALARLGYEALIVQNNSRFRRDILERLRIEAEFHGARHELSVGAFLTMAGFDVHYVDEEAGVENPDMIAIHKETGVRFAVEAKRKHRERAEDPNPRRADGSWKLRLRRPLRKAMKQVSARARPWMICVDLDLPCPIPDRSDERFLDAIVSDLNALEREWSGRGGSPELTLLIQIPYHSIDDYDLGLLPQIIPVASPTFSAATEFKSVAPFLLHAQEQFPRMPFTWEELGDGPASRSLQEPTAG